jgi:hypothetical protein
MDWIRNFYSQFYVFERRPVLSITVLVLLTCLSVCRNYLSISYVHASNLKSCVVPASKSLLSMSFFTVNGLNKLLDEVMCYPIHIGWLVHTIWLVVWLFLRTFSTFFLGKALVWESARSSKSLISKIRARYGFTDRYQLSCVGYFSYSSCRHGSESPSSPSNIASCVDWFP